MKILLLGPSSRNQKIRDFLISKGNDVFETEEELSLEFLKEKGIEFLISSGYAPIINEPIISQFHRKIINLHISYLPYGRGIYPNFWSFFDGTPSGVTIHYINSGIDSGEILFQKKLDFGENETLQTTHQALMNALETLFFESWEQIQKGDVRPKENKADRVSPYHSRIESEQWLEYLPERWNTSTQEVISMGFEAHLSRKFREIYDRELKAD